MQDKTTIIVVSDHGFKLVKNHIDINAALAEAGLSDRVYGTSRGWFCAALCQGASQTVAALRKKFPGMEGVAEVAGPKRYAALGLPHPSSDSQMADFAAIPQVRVYRPIGRVGVAASHKKQYSCFRSI
jgi:hypothetical protein